MIRRIKRKAKEQIRYRVSFQNNKCQIECLKGRVYKKFVKVLDNSGIHSVRKFQIKLEDWKKLPRTPVVALDYWLYRESAEINGLESYVALRREHQVKIYQRRKLILELFCAHHPEVAGKTIATMQNDPDAIQNPANHTFMTVPTGPFCKQSGIEHTFDRFAELFNDVDEWIGKVTPGKFKEDFGKPGSFNKFLKVRDGDFHDAPAKES